MARRGVNHYNETPAASAADLWRREGEREKHRERRRKKERAREREEEGWQCSCPPNLALSFRFLRLQLAVYLAAILSKCVDVCGISCRDIYTQFRQALQQQSSLPLRSSCFSLPAWQHFNHSRNHTHSSVHPFTHSSTHSKHSPSQALQAPHCCLNPFTPVPLCPLPRGAHLFYMPCKTHK